MARLTVEKIGRRQRRGDKDDGELVNPGVLVKGDPMVLAVAGAGKSKVESALDFIHEHTRFGAGCGSQKCCRYIFIAGADDVQIAVLAGREMKPKRLAGLHNNRVTGADCVG